MQQSSVSPLVKRRVTSLIEWLDSKPVIPINMQHDGAWIESDLFLRHYVDEIVRTICQPDECNQALDEVGRFVNSVKSAASVA